MKKTPAALRLARARARKERFLAEQGLGAKD
jgi:hypothetical protein